MVRPWRRRCIETYWPAFWNVSNESVPHCTGTKNFFLQHDNARPHTAALVQQFLASKSVSVLHHPSYSPDLSPPNYFAFQRPKLIVKGQRFEDIPTIERNVTSEDYSTDGLRTSTPRLGSMRRTLCRLERDVFWIKKIYYFFGHLFPCFRSAVLKLYWQT